MLKKNMLVMVEGVEMSVEEMLLKLEGLKKEKVMLEEKNKELELKKGGNKGFKWSEESKEKLSNSMKERYKREGGMKEEVREKIRSSMVGKKMSEGDVKKMKEGLKKYYDEKFNRVYDDNGVLISEDKGVSNKVVLEEKNKELERLNKEMEEMKKKYGIVD